MSRVAAYIFALTLALVGLDIPVGHSEPSREGRIRAAALFYLVQYTRWPSPASSTDGFRICTFGDDSAVPFLAETFAGKLVDGVPYKIESLKDGGSEVEAQRCRVIYFGEIRDSELRPYLNDRRSHPQLLVSGNLDLTKLGGDCFLYEKDNKLRIKIKYNAAQSAGLSMSSELLAIAEIVE